MQASLRRLSHADAHLVEAHLLRLDADDRSLRFAAGVVTDATIRAYCSRLRYDADVHCHCFDAAGSEVERVQELVLVAA